MTYEIKKQRFYDASKQYFHGELSIVDYKRITDAFLKAKPTRFELKVKELMRSSGIKDSLTSSQVRRQSK